MLRKLLTLAAGASAGLWAGVCGVWGGGHRRDDPPTRTNPDRRIMVASDVGLAGFVIKDPAHGSSFDVAEDGDHLLPAPPSGVWVRESWPRRRRPGTRTEGQPEIWHEHWWNRVGFDAGSEQMFILVDFGHGYDRDQPPSDFGHWTWVTVPHWSVALPLAILPLIWSKRLVRGVRQRRRGTHNRCLACGYDLRATPERCPECGATPAKEA